MKKTYFNAIELTNKPFISWMSVGTFTLEEFRASEYADDPLIIPEDEIPFPYNVFGVCPKKIVGGVLENRTPAEMAGFEAEFNIQVSVKSERLKIEYINNDKFTYEDNDFPMDEVSRLFYSCIERTAENYKIKTMVNTVFSLTDAKRADFVAAFYEKLLSISKHTV